MSMEITKNSRALSADSGGKANTGGVRVSTVELKTPKPNVTRTAQIKTGFRNTNDYSRYLQGRYGYMNTGTTSMCGVPTTVSVSGVFLAKCNGDPEKAKYLEENLAAIPDCVKSTVDYTKTMPGSPVCTYLTYIIDDNGNITCMSGCTNDPDGKIARENAERKTRERHAAEKKAEIARREAARKEKYAQKRAEEKSRISGRRVTVHAESVPAALDLIKAEFLLTDSGMSLKA